MIALNDGVDIDSGKRVFDGTGHFLNDGERLKT